MTGSEQQPSWIEDVWTVEDTATFFHVSPDAAEAALESAVVANRATRITRGKFTAYSTANIRLVREEQP